MAASPLRAPPSGRRTEIRGMPELTDYERRFRRAGLPLFIEDYTATGDVFTRAAPLLVLVFIGEMLGAIDLDWSVWANLGAVVGGLAILLVAFGLVNRLRGRPFWSVPEDVDWPELAAFVFVPALLPLIFGTQLTSALVTAGANALLLLLVYLVVGYGFVSIVRWASRRMLAQLGASLELLTRALPLLLVFANVLFLTNELWQSARTMPTSFAILLVGLLAAVGAGFLITRVPREVRALERDAGAAGPPLNTRQRLNVGLVMLVSQGLQVALVSLAVFGFFVVLGVLMVNAEVRQAFMGDAGREVLSFDLFGEPVQITRELLRVSGGIAVFSGLYWAVAVLTDSTYREEFLTELTGEMRESFRERVEYLELRAAAGA
jgi:predicted membrane channel-forming protein YqfA (hemolysin III family)